jgi:23S rRNA pseudouridine2604 synthase
MRLNKFISETGICSRRGADAWIEAGRVTVNGAVATLGTQVADGDTVAVDGQTVGAAKKDVCIAFHKPVGITCTTERHVPGNIIDYINHPQRIFPIGRLDKDSEGLILLTNNGDIVNPVLRSENGHEKEYIVTVDKPVTDAFLHGMAAGVAILDTVTQPCEVTRVDRNIFRIVLTQGLNRQIRRMCEVFGYHVRRLQRIRIVNIRLDGIARGKWRDLTTDELASLLADTPRSPPTPAPQPPPAAPDPWAAARRKAR